MDMLQMVTLHYICTYIRRWRLWSIYHISRKFDMELNLAVDDFLWSSPNLIHFFFWIILKIILGSWAIVKFNSLNEFIFQIANIFPVKFSAYMVCHIRWIFGGNLIWQINLFWVIGGPFIGEHYCILYALSNKKRI